MTYDLVGHLLRFHTDPRVEIVWFCGGTVNPLEFEKVKRGSQEAGGLKHAAVDGADDGGGRHRLVNLHGLGPDEQAARVRDEGVGVIIDLDGWIGDDPPRLTLASRPAPVRAQWLGWAGSTGDPAMHYMVSDAALAPPSLYGGRYSERLVVLPAATSSTTTASCTAARSPAAAPPSWRRRRRPRPGCTTAPPSTRRARFRSPTSTS